MVYLNLPLFLSRFRIVCVPITVAHTRTHARAHTQTHTHTHRQTKTHTNKQTNKQTQIQTQTQHDVLCHTQFVDKAYMMMGNRVDPIFNTEYDSDDDEQSQVRIGTCAQLA
jgi:carbohydrate-binding DOMON domain-containing protein